ncbi:MAG: RuBisCO large subunit C-terminal-like domain-containing protein [Candidatus Heimdallarchaeota archaeon]|nr:RuBisCO large subunit C-terminal-like domain-containing protein [Candidatus Heimdallarchaeota archaeon]MDH5644443.1 RuBisCO large subunit C-terminal-like domain-containing protein [Candidatus Heimdallarchaeota archaeon]
MSYEDNVFYQPDLEVEPEENVIVDFDVVTTANNMERVFREIPAESSVGTWQRVWSMSDDILQKLSAKTIHSQLITDTHAKIKVAYPIELFEPNNIPQMMSLFAGNVFGMNSLQYLRVNDFEVPTDFANSFPGPAFGIQGIYDTLGIEKGPILGTIVKPKLGAPPEVHAKVTMDSWSGGLQWVKDDEPQTNQDFCPFEDRISRVLEYADQIKSEQGRQVIYACNITGTIETMVKRAEYVKDHGGKCLMIDVVTVGFSGVQYIREQNFGLPIHAHRAMHGAITRHHQHGIHMKVLAKAYRMIGVDAIHTGTIYGKMGYGKIDEDKKEVFSSNQALTDKLGNLKPVMPIASGGVGVTNIGKIIQALAPNVIITAGGGVHGHPNGSQDGAKSLVQAKEAGLQGIVDEEPLYQWSIDNNKEELQIALKKLLNKD